MMLLWTTIIATLVGLASAVTRRDSGFKVFSQDQVDSTNVYAHYAAATLCDPQTFPYWQCGSHCQATPNFELYTNGGDGVTAPIWLVGYDNSLDSIMVVHQGPDKKKFFTGLTNANGALTALDPTIFPNISSAVQVYKPYATVHSQSAGDVLQAVGTLIQSYPNADVTTVGYSLGGAIALLDGLLLRMLLAPTTDVKVVTYGMSRIGNDAFAGMVDAVLPGSVKHINNMRDPVPVVPAISLGYHQVSGEIHIQDNGKWISCPGEDNADPRCTAGTVTSINNAHFSDHPGPYNNIMINCNS